MATPTDRIRDWKPELGNDVTATKCIVCGKPTERFRFTEDKETPVGFVCNRCWHKPVVGAYISKGNLCMAIEDAYGRHLVCYPIFANGRVDWETEVIPEPERISKEDREDLENIARWLNCKLL